MPETLLVDDNVILCLWSGVNISSEFCQKRAAREHVRMIERSNREFDYF